MPPKSLDPVRTKVASARRLRRERIATDEVRIVVDIFKKVFNTPDAESLVIAVAHASPYRITTGMNTKTYYTKLRLVYLYLAEAGFSRADIKHFAKVSSATVEYHLASIIGTLKAHPSLKVTFNEIVAQVDKLVTKEFERIK